MRPPDLEVPYSPSSFNLVASYYYIASLCPFFSFLFVDFLRLLKL